MVGRGLLGAGVTGDDLPAQEGVLQGQAVEHVGRQEAHGQTVSGTIGVDHRSGQLDRGIEVEAGTAAQQAAAWDASKVRRAGIAGMPAEGQARMKADTCTPEFRARFERDIQD